MIRADLGFGGIVISDDIGDAKQVAAWAPGTRAINFLICGGDVVLTVNPSLIPAMVNAVSARVSSNAPSAGRCRPRRCGC